MYDSTPNLAISAIARRYMKIRSVRRVIDDVLKIYAIDDDTIAKGIKLGKQWAREYDRIHGK